MTTDTDLADLARALLRDDAEQHARRMVARPVDDEEQCADCWKFRPRRPWTVGRRRDLCGRCWRKAQNAITVRSWSGRRVSVATNHPQYGELRRGTIHMERAGGGWRMVWHVHDFEGHDLGRVVGDYVDAEARLLAATAWADEIDDNQSTNEEE